MTWRRRGSPALVGAVTLGAALWGLTHTVTHRLIAPAVAGPTPAGGYAGPLGPLILATLGLLVLSSLVMAGSVLRAKSHRTASYASPATAIAPAVFTTLETLTHLDAHHGAPPVGLVLIGSCIHAVVVGIVRQLWASVRPHLRRLPLFRGSVPEPAARRCALACADPEVQWTLADAWSGRAPPTTVSFPMSVMPRELTPV
ncbi:MAG: hypothetical protein AB7V74_26480 [Acidimicrobiia bacterium]|jgi:hypothetical protein